MCQLTSFLLPCLLLGYPAGRMSYSANLSLSRVLMQDLRAAVKGGVDPNGVGSSVVAADVLWSDPVAEPGLRANVARGVGLIFGPDVTQVPILTS